MTFNLVFSIDGPRFGSEGPGLDERGDDSGCLPWESGEDGEDPPDSYAGALDGIGAVSAELVLVSSLLLCDSELEGVLAASGSTLAVPSELDCGA